MREAILEHLRTAVPFAAHVGIDLLSVGNGEGKAQLVEASHGLNHVGTHHAGALFTLSEAASGAAMAGALAPVLMQVMPLASTARIDFRKPARGLITAVAKVDGDPQACLLALQETGKVTFKVDVTLTDEQGVVVAMTEVDWHVRQTSPAA